MGGAKGIEQQSEDKIVSIIPLWLHLPAVNGVPLGKGILMRLVRTSIDRDRLPGFQRHEAIFRSSQGREFTFFLIFSNEFESWLSSRQDHWLILGATSAALLGESYSQDAPVSALLKRHLLCLVRQWAAWFPGRKPFTIDAPTVDDEDLGGAAMPRQKGLFYTGGVDSLFSLIMRGSDVDVLVKALFNWNDEEELVRKLQAQPTEVFGRRQLVVGTNVLHPFPEFRDAWAYLTHGPALGAIGHLFSKQISNLIFSSSISYGDLIPWGSHPLTDPLLSSSTLQFEHYGAAYSRVEKVLRVAESAEHVGHLVVCSQVPHKKYNGTKNCSRCQKCLRTMASIELSGIDLSLASSFDWSDYKFGNLAGIRLYHPNEYIMFQELLDGAMLRGRHDIAEAVRLTMSKSGKYVLVAFVEDYLRRRFPSLVSQKPIFKSAKRVFMKLAPH